MFSGFSLCFCKSGYSRMWNERTPSESTERLANTGANAPVVICLFSPQANGSLIAATSSHRVQHPIKQCSQSSSPVCPTRSDAQTRTKKEGKAMMRMSHGRGIGHFFLPPAASAAFFSSAIWRRKRSEIVQRASPARHTFSLLLTHDVGSTFLELLKLRA